MSEHDGPPILISEEWQQQHEPRRAANDTDAAPGADPDDRHDTVILPLVEDEGPPVDPPGPVDELPPADAAAEQPDQDHLTVIREELTALRAETVHVNQILDRLHAENERLRRGESEQLLMPLFRDLMKLAHDWTGMAGSWASRESATPADVAQRCREIADDAGLILARHGVDPLDPAVGTPVDRKQHRVVGTVAAETAELDNTVAEVRRVGYVHGEKVVKFAEVVVAKHAG